MATTTPFLITSEVAARLRCSVRTVHELTRLGLIPHRRLPGSRRCLFRIDELEAWEDGARLETVDLGARRRSPRSQRSTGRRRPLDYARARRRRTARRSTGSCSQSSKIGRSGASPWTTSPSCSATSARRDSNDQQSTKASVRRVPPMRRTLSISATRTSPRGLTQLGRGTEVSSAARRTS